MSPKRKPLPRKTSSPAERQWARLICLCGTCGKCGTKGRVHAHHIIPRRFGRFRTDARNGIALCFTCHVGGPESAHNAPLAFRKWLWNTLPGTMAELHAECPEAKLRKGIHGD